MLDFLFYLAIGFVSYHILAQNITLPVIIFDIDDTVIKHFPNPLPGLAPDYIYNDKYIYIRPYLRQILRTLAYRGQLAFWTAAHENWARALINNLGIEETQLKFFWHREQTEKGIKTEKYFVLNSPVPLRHTILVDDLVHPFPYLIRVPPFNPLANPSDNYFKDFLDKVLFHTTQTSLFKSLKT